MAIAESLSPGYPVSIDVQPTTEPRNKLTVGFRLILAFPHVLLVGGLGLTGAWFGYWNQWGGLLSNGALAAVAAICAVFAWFAIIFADQHPEGLRKMGMFYLRWRTNALAYMGLFRDEYPPFGEGDYPASVNVELAEFPRDKVSVGLRLLYLIPHFVVLFFLSLAWTVTSVIAWFAILFNGEYPESLYKFGVGVMRWTLRVEAYGLLLVDQYPPFSLD